SEACRAEIRLFAKTIRAGGGDPATSGRIFLVPIDEVDRRDWPADFPEIFHNILGYPFWEMNGHNVPEQIVEDAYRTKLNDLRTALARQLKGMGAENPQTPAETRPTHESPATVCLAKVTSDLRKTREQIATYLVNAGIRVLPLRPYSADPSKFVNAFEKDLEEAHVFVQILGESYSDRT